MSLNDQDEIAEIEVSTNEELPETDSKEPPPDTLRILEAVLFASEEIMPASRLKTILPDNPDARQIRKMVDKINEILQRERHPFEIVEIGGGYQFRTVSYYHPWVRQIFKEKAAKKLSIQSLECLAIIAYKQPLSKAEIEAIRGVVSDGAMKTLLEKRLVTITGRSEKPGRPLQYGTTTEFLKYFGLNKIEDLPRLEEFEAIAREKIDELSLDELQSASEPAVSSEEQDLDGAVSTNDSTNNAGSLKSEGPGKSDVPVETIQKKADTAVRANSIEEIEENDDSSEFLSETVDIEIDNNDGADFEIQDGNQVVESENESVLDTVPDEELTPENEETYRFETIKMTPISDEPISVEEVDEDNSGKSSGAGTKRSKKKKVTYTDGFEINDDISDDEMTETTLQARDAAAVSNSATEAVAESSESDDEVIFDQKTKIILKQDAENIAEDVPKSKGPSHGDEGDFEVLMPPDGKR
jgi:segregation and condensation protein B